MDSSCFRVGEQILPHTGPLLTNPMNHLLIGTADKTQHFIQLAISPFLLLDDGPIADAFLDHFPKAKLFDITKHSFNPLAAIDYKRARDFAAALYTASPEGENTLTVRNGKRAMARLLLTKPERLDKLPDPDNDPGTIEATATIDDILLSPVLKRVLATHTNFAFKGSVVVRLDRAAIGDFDAFVLASLLTGQHQGQIIIPDFGFYGREFHTSLIRQNRLIAGVHFLSELGKPDDKLRQAAILINDKLGEHCTPQDAETLAMYAGLPPTTNGYNEFIESLIG